MPNATTPDRVNLDGPSRHFHGRLGAELPCGVEYPCGTKPAERARLGGLADGREIRFHVLHAPQHHARRNRDFGVDDVLPDSSSRSLRVMRA